VGFSRDDYEDIFSDFDTRPFAERMLSDDFLYELKRASLDKDEVGLNPVLLVPKQKRFAGQEPLIKDRLRDHFKRHRRRIEEKIRRERKTGVKMIALGIFFMFVATYILSHTEKNLDHFPGPAPGTCGLVHLLGRVGPDPFQVQGSDPRPRLFQENDGGEDHLRVGIG
jgi:hypothetical protein